MTLAPVLKRIDAYERLIRLDKPIGWLLLLWPALWALWIAAEGRHVILFRADEGVLKIVRVLHVAMDFKRHPSPGDEW